MPSASGIEPLRELAGDASRVTGILVEPDRAGLEALAALVEAGAAARPRRADVPARAGRAQAHELGETGRTQGKLVLTVD